jgi:hypothetical protein
MRWSTGLVPPVLTSDYDNAGYIPAGTFATFVWNVKPRIDVNFKGNGDPAFISAGSYPVPAKWIQIYSKHLKSNWNSI